MTLLFSRAKAHLTKTPVIDIRNLFRVFDWDYLRNSQNIKPSAVALGYPSEAKHKFLLWKTLCTSETEPRDP